MINNIINHKATIYLVASIVPLMSISIFLADLILSILSILFLVFIIKKNSLIFYKNNFFLLSLVFYSICLASSFLSNEIFFSLKSSLPLIRVIIFIFLICYLIEKNNKFIDLFFKVLKFTFLILSIYGLTSYLIEFLSLSATSEIGEKPDGTNIQNIRLTLPFSDEGKLGSYLVRLYGLYFAIYLIKNETSKFEKIFLFFMTISTSLVILLSGERSSLFFMLLIFFICIIFLNINLKKKLIFLSPIVICFALVITLNNNLSNRIIFDKNNQIDLKSENIIIFTPQHTAHYRTAINIFIDQPFIGQGPKTFRKLCKNSKYNEVVNKDGNSYQGCSSHPHNTYIQLLAETGIIGTLLFSLGFFHIFINFIKHFSYLFFKKGKKLNNYQVIINASALIVFWPFSPSGNFFNNWMLIMYALPLSFYVNEYFKYKNLNKN